MRALVLNDTRSENHLGCALVMGNLFQLCRQHGVQVIGSVPHSAGNDERIACERAHEYDALLVNGEGTMHHDQPKALALGRAAQGATRQGKKVVLLNTVWQANDELNRYLPHFDLIFCRESKSQAALATAGARATVAPDLVFATQVNDKAIDRSRRGTVVVDAVDRATTLSWARFAWRRRFAFLTMHDVQYRLIRRRPLLYWGLHLRSGVSVATMGGGYVNQLGRFERVVSGRFHGCCLALLLGLPVLGIPSNTHKIEGLLADAGIGEEGVLRSAPCAAELERRFADVARRAEQVREYVARARRQIWAMFAEIQEWAQSDPVRRAG